MKKIWKKTITLMMTAAIGISMNYPKMTVCAGQKMQMERYTTSKEWNREEIKAYQFDSTDQFENYLQAGGSYLYNDKFQEKDCMVKITVADSGYFTVATETDGNRSQRVKLYDSTKKKVLAQTTSDGDLEYGRLAKAGESFYLQLPTKIDKIFVTTGVIKDGFDSMKASDTYYESGAGNVTYHPFSITKRAAVEFNISAIDRNSGVTYAHIEKKEKGQWKRIDDTLKINPASYDDDFVHGLTKGEYRLAIKAPTTQLNAVSYTSSSKNKNVAYKKSKAKKIKLDGQTSNIYTTGEKTARWYSVSVTSTKKKRILNLGKDTVSGGYKFTIYQKGKKKAIKTMKVTGNANAKIVKMPKKKGTYYIRISKLTKKTNGTYEIGYY